MWFSTLGTSGRRHLCILSTAATVVLASPRLQAQTIPVEVSGRFGLALVPGQYDASCTNRSEGVLRAGIASGKQGYRQEGNTSARSTLPHVGGQINVIVFRSVVLSTSVHWNRLTYETRLVGSTAVESQSSWYPMLTAQFGLRLPPRP